MTYEMFKGLSVDTQILQLLTVSGLQLSDAINESMLKESIIAISKENADINNLVFVFVNLPSQKKIMDVIVDGDKKDFEAYFKKLVAAKFGKLGGLFANMVSFEKSSDIIKKAFPDMTITEEKTPANIKTPKQALDDFINYVKEKHDISIVVGSEMPDTMTLSDVEDIKKSILTSIEEKTLVKPKVSDVQKDLLEDSPKEVRETVIENDPLEKIDEEPVTFLWEFDELQKAIKENFQVEGKFYIVSAGDTIITVQFEVGMLVIQATFNNEYKMIMRKLVD